MSEEHEDEAKGLLGAVYKDALHPAVSEVGGTLGASIRLLLSPVNFGIRTAQAAADDLFARTERRLAERGRTPGQLTTPSAELIAPVVESFRYENQDDTLRDLYVNLVATAMEVERAGDAHPAFPHILRQMTPQEARALFWFSTRSVGNPSFPLLRVTARDGANEWPLSGYFLDLCPAEPNAPFKTGDRLPQASIDNFIRLGLAEIPEGKLLISEAYRRLESWTFLDDLATHKQQTTKSQEGRLLSECEIVKMRALLSVTELGRTFANVCTGHAPPLWLITV